MCLIFLKDVTAGRGTPLNEACPRGDRANSHTLDARDKLRPMPDQNPTVAEWLAWGEATIALHCNALGCGHYAVVRIDNLDPRMTRDEVGRRARCAVCGHRGGTVMRDMDAHDAALMAKGWSGRPSMAPRARGPDEDEPR